MRLSSFLWLYCLGTALIEIHVVCNDNCETDVILIIIYTVAIIIVIVIVSGPGILPEKCS